MALDAVFSNPKDNNTYFFKSDKYLNTIQMMKERTRLSH